MPVPTKNVAVFGSTGSIGKNALEVIAASEGRLNAIALSAYGKLDLLIEQARQFRPKWVIAADEGPASRFDWTSLPPGTQLRHPVENGFGRRSAEAKKFLICC